MALTHVVTQLVSASKGPVAINDYALVPGCLMLPHVTTVITRATKGGAAAERAMEAVVGVNWHRSPPVSSGVRNRGWCDEGWGLRREDWWLGAKVVDHAI